MRPELLEAIAAVMREHPIDGYREFEHCHFPETFGWSGYSNWPQLVTDAGSFPERVRRRPRTIEIAGVSVPEPLREAPEEGERYWRAALRHDKTLVQGSTWCGDKIEYVWLRRGLLHFDHDSAKQHARALIKASGGEVGDE